VPTNLVRKLMGMNIMQAAIITFFIALAAKAGAELPVVRDGEAAAAAQYVNPLPHALMLTAIVVSVSTTGVALALIIGSGGGSARWTSRTLIDQLRR
jgi:multicomponent Na+:H+ antiporter subunit C